MKQEEKLHQSRFITARDNLKISGTEYIYGDKADKKYPAAIVCHGFMANQASVKGYAKFLAKMGYAAYCFDFCGGCAALGKSDGKTTDMTVMTEVSDLKAVVKYVKALPYISDYLLLMGCSQGGFVSALTAAEGTFSMDKLVLFYPAFCIPDDARRGSMMFAHFDPGNIPDTIRCGPMMLGGCYPKAVIDMDVYSTISPYKGKVLIVHGSSDRIVNVEYSINAAKVYNNAELVVIDGADHGFNMKDDKIAREKLRKFANPSQN